MLVVTLLCAVYLYLLYVQDDVKNAKWMEKRCLFELSSVKYQLNVATEYKTQVEKMLSDSQRAHDLDKDKFKDIAESCVTMKQQSLLCQSQFDDLQSECKKVRETYNKDKNELANFKETLENVQKSKESLQHTVFELYAEIDNLRKDNRNLRDKLQAHNKLDDVPPISFESNIRTPSNKTLSQQVELSSGVYRIGNGKQSRSVSSLDTESMKNSNKAIPDTKPKNSHHFPGANENVDASNNLLPLNSEKTENKVLHIPPPGFAPVLSVLENSENSLPKPVEAKKEQEESNKPINVGDDKAYGMEHKFEAGPLVEPQEENVIEDNVKVENIDLGHENKADEENEGQIAIARNPAAQEDDEYGEEYVA